jgi:FMN reductase
VQVTAINGSPSRTSKTAALAAAAVQLAGEGEVVHLGDLDAEGLLGRHTDGGVTDALNAISGAQALMLATPVYRATYSGLLKVLMDQLPPDALAGIPVVLGATAGGSQHLLCVDHGLRPLVASLGGWSVPTAIYATPLDFEADGDPLPAVIERLRVALGEAQSLVDR